VKYGVYENADDDDADEELEKEEGDGDRDDGPRGRGAVCGEEGCACTFCLRNEGFVACKESEMVDCCGEECATRCVIEIVVAAAVVEPICIVFKQTVWLTRCGYIPLWVSETQLPGLFISFEKF